MRAWNPCPRAQLKIMTETNECDAGPMNKWHKWQGHRGPNGHVWTSICSSGKSCNQSCDRCNLFSTITITTLPSTALLTNLNSINLCSGKLQLPLLLTPIYEISMITKAKEVSMQVITAHTVHRRGKMRFSGAHTKNTHFSSWKEGNLLDLLCITHGSTLHALPSRK